MPIHLFPPAKNVLVLLLCGLMMGIVSCEEEAACVSQEEKEVLITSYLRLADLLKNVSSTICEQLTQQSESADHDTIAYNCAEIDHIIVQLKATTDLTESRRDEYNHLLVSITERILQIAKTTKDQQVADKINTLRREMERELKVVRNKNIKLTNSRSRAQIAAEQARHERDAAVAAQANAEKLLAEYRAQHPPNTLSASEQMQLQRLQTEVSKARRERDEAVTAQQRLETQQSELKKQLEQTKKDKTSQVESDNTPISSPNIIDNTPTSPTATSVAAPITMSMPQLKKHVQQKLGNISPIHRPREDREQLRQLFASPSAEIIFTDNNSYSIDSYWDKLSLLGPYDIHITDIKTDLQGKITSMKIEETRLTK